MSQILGEGAYVGVKGKSSIGKVLDMLKHSEKAFVLFPKGDSEVFPWGHLTVLDGQATAKSQFAEMENDEKDYERLKEQGGEAPKSIEGKARLDLVPLDMVDELLEPLYRVGAINHAENSWREGFKVSTAYASIRRHLNSFYYKHEDFDVDNLRDTGIETTHLGAIMFWCLAAYNSMLKEKGFDDRPCPGFVEKKEVKYGEK